jgi:hypothetical protein
MNRVMRPDTGHQPALDELESKSGLGLLGYLEIHLNSSAKDEKPHGHSIPKTPIAKMLPPSVLLAA